MYLYVCEDGNVEIDTWDDCCMDYVFYKIGNCYKKDKDALKDVEKWKKFYSSDEVINVF